MTALVLFDFDGVLADSEVIALNELRTVLAENGVEMSVSEVADRFLGTSVHVPMQYVESVTGKACADDFVTTWHQRLFDRFERELRPMPGAGEMLSALSAEGVPVCIASGASVSRLDFALKCVGLRPYFDGAVFSAEVVGRSKPEPDLFLHAARVLSVAPADCVVLDDAPSGVSAAVSAGMTAYGFVGGSHLIDKQAEWADKLSALGAVRSFHTLGAFAGALQERPASNQLIK